MHESIEQIRRVRSPEAYTITDHILRSFSITIELVYLLWSHCDVNADIFNASIFWIDFIPQLIRPLLPISRFCRLVCCLTHSRIQPARPWLCAVVPWSINLNQALCMRCAHRLLLIIWPAIWCVQLWFHEWSSFYRSEMPATTPSPRFAAAWMLCADENNSREFVCGCNNINSVKLFKRLLAFILFFPRSCGRMLYSCTHTFLFSISCQLTTAENVTKNQKKKNTRKNWMQPTTNNSQSKTN